MGIHERTAKVAKNAKGRRELTADDRYCRPERVGESMGLSELPQMPEM